MFIATYREDIVWTEDAVITSLNTGAHIFEETAVRVIDPYGIEIVFIFVPSVKLPVVVLTMIEYELS
jgi:hypothetical protein